MRKCMPGLSGHLESGVQDGVGSEAGIARGIECEPPNLAGKSSPNVQLCKSFLS